MEARIDFTSLSEEFDSDGVMVTLEWAPTNSVYSYQVTVVPSPLGVLSSDSETFRVQLKVSYDVLYNVSVVSSLCDQTGAIIASVSTTLHYGKSITLYYGV